MKTLHAILLIILCSTPGKGQICYKFHESCLFADWEFYYSRQSASALFEPNQTSSLRFFADGGEKYYISICGEKVFKRSIKFKVYEEDNPDVVLYNNELDHFNQTVTFINEQSRNLVVEVTAPNIVVKSEGEDTKFCIGVLIQFSEISVNLPESGKTGFQ